MLVLYCTAQRHHNDRSLVVSGMGESCHYRVFVVCGQNCGVFESTNDRSPDAMSGRVLGSGEDASVTLFRL